MDSKLRLVDYEEFDTINLEEDFRHEIEYFLDKIDTIPILYHLHKCAGTYFTTRLKYNFNHTINQMHNKNEINNFRLTYKQNSLIVLDDDFNYIFRLFFISNDYSFLDKFKIWVKYSNKDSENNFTEISNKNAVLLKTINENKDSKLKFIEDTFNKKLDSNPIDENHYTYSFTINIKDFLNYSLLDNNIKILFIEICSYGFSHRNKLNKFLESQNIKFKNFMILRNAFERQRSLFKYINSSNSKHEPTHGSIVSKTFHEYVESEEFEQDWIYRNFFGIKNGEEFKMSKKIFDNLINEISDFELATIKNVDILLNKIFVDYYFIKEMPPANWGMHVVYNKSNEKTLEFHELNTETKKIFKKRAKWEIALFNYVDDNSLNKEAINIGCSYGENHTKKYADCVKNKNDDYNQFNDEYKFNSLCKLQNINGKILITRESDSINSYTLIEKKVLIISLMNQKNIKNDLQIPDESIKTFWKIKCHLITSNLLNLISLNKSKFDKIYLVNPPNRFMDYADLLPSHFEILENGEELLLNNTKLTICSPILSEMNLNGLQKIREVRCKNNNKNDLHERLLILKPQSECKYLEETFSKLHQNLQVYCKEKKIDLVVSHDESGELVDKFYHFLRTSKYMVVFTEFENPQFLFNCINKNSKVLEITQASSTYSQTSFELNEVENNLIISENVDDDYRSIQTKFITNEKKTFLMTINNLYNGWFNLNLKYRLLCLNTGVDISKFNNKILRFFNK